ncbi:hypothetical protein M758_6G165300 [Ceratodon purpureus]|uniref:Uncharacterized protein n=1 Tax=Ceratodon purpureus TaxID=3225 RepID=A0A8T0HIK3_CERPU|nr:hypothetical protein KC19_6G171700 [Ceratodon purpureus]KAG0614288.1 hypothetical protein M758_6G165300 [Ceratodon purpureus]
MAVVLVIVISMTDFVRMQFSSPLVLEEVIETLFCVDTICSRTGMQGRRKFK